MRFCDSGLLIYITSQKARTAFSFLTFFGFFFGFCCVFLRFLGASCKRADPAGDRERGLGFLFDRSTTDHEADDMFVFSADSRSIPGSGTAPPPPPAWLIRYFVVRSVCCRILTAV